MAELSDPSGAVYLKRDNSGEAAILRNSDQNTPADFFLRHQEKQAALEAARKKKAEEEKAQPITEDYTPENRVITQVTNPDDIAELSNDITNAKTEGAMLTHAYKTGKLKDADYTTQWQQHQYGTKAATLGKITLAAKENTYRETMAKQMRDHPDDYADEDKQHIQDFYKKPIGQRDMKPIERLSDVKTIGYAGKDLTIKNTTTDRINADGTKTTVQVKTIEPYDLNQRAEYIEAADDKQARALKKQHERAISQNEDVSIPIVNSKGEETTTVRPAKDLSFKEWVKAKILNETGSKLMTSVKQTIPKADQLKTSSGSSYTAGTYQYDYLKNNDGTEEVTVKKTKGGSVEKETFTDRDGKQFEGTFSGYEYNPARDGDKNIKIFVDRVYKPISGKIRVDIATGKQLKEGEKSASGDSRDVRMYVTREPKSVRVTVPPTNENMGKAKFGGVSFWDIRDAVGKGQTGTVEAGGKVKSTRTSTSTAAKQSNEVERKTKDGKVAVFDATTKQFIRYK